jgi:anti-sigma B factor antagonist
MDVSDTPGTRFRITQHERLGRFRLVLSGDLDMASAPELASAIARLCTAGALEIELDLRDLSFVDPAGLGALADARERCSRHRATLFLIPGPSAQRTLLQAAGLPEELCRARGIEITEGEPRDSPR